MTAETRNQPVSRRELWRLYRTTGLFNKQRLSRLESSFSAVEATWDRLLAADDRILWHDHDGEAGRPTASCLSYRHTLQTRISQHWVSFRNSMGGTRVLLETIRRYRSAAESRYLRSFFRPTNPLSVRLFRSLFELSPADACSLNDFEHFRVKTDTRETPEDTPLDEIRGKDIPVIVERLADHIDRLTIAAEGLDGPDPLCRSVGSIYASQGLRRERALFPIPADDGDGASRSLGVLLVDYSSMGLSLSGFNNAARILTFAAAALPEKGIRRALDAARAFFAARAIPEFALFLDHDAAFRLDQGANDACRRTGPCNMITFDVVGEHTDMMERHIRAFFEARVGMVRIVANLSEEELDWINTRGDRLAYHSGETIIREGEIASTLYLIQSGEVGVFKGEGAKKHQLAICRAPDVVGEVGVLHGIRRTATVVALTPVIALGISSDRLKEFFRVFPEGGRALHEALINRLTHEVKVERSPALAGNEARL